MKKLSIINLIFCTCVIIFVGLFFYEYNKKVSELENKNTNLNLAIKAYETKFEFMESSMLSILALYNRISSSESEIDFSASNLQGITGGFNVKIKDQKKHLNGIKFTGFILNTQSVSHENALFSIKINDISKEFTVFKLLPGKSSSFEVYVPELNPSDSMIGTIKYINSVVSYYK